MLIKAKDSVIKYWYLYILGIVLVAQALVFLIFRDNSYIQIHDNLDLFMAHYEMIKLNHAWFAHGQAMPMLHGIDRNLLGSEFLLYNLLYIIFPNFVAYILGYGLKIAIGIISFILLFKDIYGEKYAEYKPVIIAVALAYGLIPVFPAYGIAFTSVPLIALLIRRIYIKPSILLYLAVFCYPFLSYFSYHGFFILAYMCVAVLILWVKDKKFPLSVFASICTLAIGYVAFEYRLFQAMLFDDTVTIRTTMEHGELTFGQAIKTAFTEFIQASFHNQDSHTIFILWVVLIAIVVTNVIHVKNNEAKKICTDPINLVFLWIVFNCLNFGLYEFAPYRQFVETLVPKLTGFEFARTAYFNTFLWYVMLLLICVRLYDSKLKRGILIANVMAIVAIIVVMLTPQVYNDFYYTVYNQAYKMLKHKETSTVNYREFYSSDLFADIKSDMVYNGEWSAAYGLHPAVLQYNGIATVDGYLGMYPQEYKEKWIKIEEPAFAGSPSLSDYFKGWGARVCLYSGNDENTYAPLRVMDPEDKRLLVNMDELKTLDVKYIFARFEISNADDNHMTLKGVYEDESSPYQIFVYEVD